MVTDVEPEGLRLILCAAGTSLITEKRTAKTQRGDGEEGAPTNERIRRVNRIKGLLFSQGVSDYEPLRRDRRQRLEGCKTADGRPRPAHLKAQISRELDQLELLLEQITSLRTTRASVRSQPRPNGVLSRSARMVRRWKFSYFARRRSTRSSLRFFCLM